MPRLTLYQILGVPPTAGEMEVRSAFEREMALLESRRAQLTHLEFSERQQLLQVASDTLVDPFLRARYDAELEAKARARAAAAGSPLARREQARADALGLRADALSLRADAMLARAELDAFATPGPAAATRVLDATKLLVRAIGLLTLIGVLAFGITRCAAVGSIDKRAEIEAKAAEQIRLEEYHRTYGVRPANIAELELLETERRRQENEARLAEQEKRAREEAERRWQSDWRQLGERAEQDRRAAEMARRNAEYEARQRAARDLELKYREEELQLELQEARSDRERARIELQIRQLREQRQLR